MEVRVEVETETEVKTEVEIKTDIVDDKQEQGSRSHPRAYASLNLWTIFQVTFRSTPGNVDPTDSFRGVLVLSQLSRTKQGTHRTESRRKEQREKIRRTRLTVW